MSFVFQPFCGVSPLNVQIVKILIINKYLLDGHEYLSSVIVSVPFLSDWNTHSVSRTNRLDYSSISDDNNDQSACSVRQFVVSSSTTVIRTQSVDSRGSRIVRRYFYLVFKRQNDATVLCPSTSRSVCTVYISNITTSLSACPSRKFVNARHTHTQSRFIEILHENGPLCLCLMFCCRHTRSDPR